MRITRGPDAEQVLLTKNERGNTPLNFAASMGNMKMCGCIASVNPSLIVIFSTGDPKEQNKRDTEECNATLFSL
ncbi:hypothetical protein FEM48_Zijuj09G0044900 [Ziziphus jujuba var. spinosa]|uniref:Uncharacterized protein n=1 Tax=Ziziphus jujuba var. spinosa TaxID=714518 RepID=A0A978UQW8_ZIZJJ|nr:hypothetical protein FEM48_Zijuj09G0044900 [Ziziphus jujuba var. spinosa]